MTMNRVPAVCDSCGSIFATCIAAGKGRLTFDNRTAGPCPLCGATGTIPDGIYTVVEGVLRALVPHRTMVQLRQLAAVLEEARRTATEPNQVDEQIKREAPELTSIVDALPKTRTELYLFIGLIVAAISAVAGVAALWKGGGPSDADIQQIVDQSMVRTLKETEIKDANLKPGTSKKSTELQEAMDRITKHTQKKEP